MVFHGDDTMDISAVRLWVRNSRNSGGNSRNSGGNLELNIQLRSGRPVTAHHYVNSQTFDELIKKNANHSSLIRNNVVPCICLRVMTYAWSDVKRNAGIRKTNRATRYVGPRVAGRALCYRVVTYCLYAQESFNTLQRTGDADLRF